VTLGAKFAMPSACRPVRDVLCQLDAFGEPNARTWIPTDLVVDNAGHHTNTEIAWHLPVTRVLKQRREQDALPVPVTSRRIGRRVLRPAA
jgi:hypothetical protein